jgi:hypothetical protein
MGSPVLHLVIALAATASLAVPPIAAQSPPARPESGSATAARADDGPVGSMISGHLRRAERLYAGGHRVQAADVWSGMAEMISLAAPDSAYALLARARSVYGEAGDRARVVEVDERVGRIRSMHRVRDIMNGEPGTEAALDSLAAECASGRVRVDDGGGCGWIRYQAAMQGAARASRRGDFDAARGLLGGIRDDSVSGIPFAAMARGAIVAHDATIGHSPPVSGIWTMLRDLIVTSDGADGEHPFGLLPAEVRALRAGREPADALATLRAAEERLRGAGRTEQAEAVASLRVAALAMGGRPGAADEALQGVLATATGDAETSAARHAFRALNLEVAGDETAALAAAREAVRHAERVTGETGRRQLRGMLHAVARLAALDPASVAEARATLDRAESLPHGAGEPDLLDVLDRDLARGEVLRRIAHGRPPGPAREALFDTAHARFEAAAAVVASVRTRFRSDHDAVAWADRTSLLYDGWVGLWAARAAAAGSLDGDAAALTALGVAERGRAQALRDLQLRSSQAADPPLEPHASAALAARLLGTARASGAAVLYLHHAQRGELHIWLAAPGGEVRLLPARRLPRGWLDRQVEAVGRGMRLAYARTDTLPASYADSVDAWKDALAVALDSLATLVPHEALAALPDSTELVVVPNGLLAQIPFAALRIPVGTARPYLVTRFAVRHAPSLAALAAAEAIPPRIARGGASPPPDALVASWAAPDRPLERAAEEAGAVAALLGARALPAERATERGIRDAMRGASVVHLAVHARASADPRWSRDSTGVHLRPDADPATAGSAGDGFLSVGEILEEAARGPFAAELVVLSGCDTGLGQTSRSEGTLGLQRALLAGGARSVLASLWLVDDAAGAALMTAFWRHWLHDPDRPSKAQALRRAQLALSRTAPSYHWAAFQLAGGS